MIGLFKKIKRRICDCLSVFIAKRTGSTDLKKIQKALPVLFFIKTGKRLFIENPITYREKLQAYKLALYNQDYRMYVDKLRVTDWVKGVIGEQYIVEVLKIWDTTEQISFDGLPTSFFLKCNNGSGMNLFVKDKNKIEMKKIKSIVSKWLEIDFVYQNGFEMQYKGIVPKVYAERIVGESSDIFEYKFLCFNGRPYYCICDFDRFDNHTRNVYDLNWVLQPWNTGAFSNSPNSIEKPSCFSTMVELVTKLCQGFSHVRVDLYESKGKVFFNELTFTPASGYFDIQPEEYDYKLGQLWNQ